MEIDKQAKLLLLGEVIEPRFVAEINPITIEFSSNHDSRLRPHYAPMPEITMTLKARVHETMPFSDNMQNKRFYIVEVDE